MENINIRKAEIKDVKNMAEIEALCFPSAEAAKYEDFKIRFSTFPGCFLIAEKDNTLVGFIDGAVTDKPNLPDELYHEMKFHHPCGAFQTVFSLAVTPKFQHQGIGKMLMNSFIEDTENRGKKGIVLTCKDHLIGFYKTFGFVHKGISNSTHGGAKWNDMLLLF